ncbi:MAG: ATP-grasp domain-containing protein [Planctomycetaceae bacterium]
MPPRVRLFISEYLCSGAWPESELPASLAREGRAMLLALLVDVARLPGVTVCTTWDARMSGFPLNAPIDCAVAQSPRDESAAFRRLAAECDATYVIAPELDDLLTQRVQAVLDAGGRSLNASPASIAACSDKWETFRRLSAAGIPTVPTARFVPGEPAPFEFPIVLKPRFGAGSQDTFLIHNADQVHAAAVRFTSNLRASSIQQSAVSSWQDPKSAKVEAIVQPYVPGRALSVAAVFRTDGTLRELWPVGEQRLSADGRFTYFGGRMPLSLHAVRSFEISNLKSEILRIAACFPGLRGYVGFDLILPQTNDRPPLIVDINPRLTTSYLGYRALARTNLARPILWPDQTWPPLEWGDNGVVFNADGAVVRSPAHCR